MVVGFITLHPAISGEWWSIPEAELAYLIATTALAAIDFPASLLERRLRRAGNAL